MKFSESGYFAQNLQQSVASALNVKIKRGTVRLNEYAGGVVYPTYRLSDPVLMKPIEAGAVVNQDMRRLLLDGLQYPEAREDNMRVLTEDWSRYKVTTEAYDLLPLSGYLLSARGINTGDKKDRDKRTQQEQDTILEQGDEVSHLVIPSVTTLVPASILTEMWEATVRIIGAVLGSDGLYVVPPFFTSTPSLPLKPDPEMATSMFVLRQMRAKLQAGLAGKTLLTQLGTKEGQQLWGLTMFHAMGELWDREFRLPGNPLTKALLTRLFFDTLPALGEVISQEYEFTYVEGKENNVTDRAIRNLDKAVSALKLLEPLPHIELGSGPSIDEFRIQSLSSYWKLVGSLKAARIEYYGTAFNMERPPGTDTAGSFLGTIIKEGLTFGSETADILIPIGVNEKYSDPGFLRTTAPPERLATTITLPHPIVYDDPATATEIVEQIRQSRIAGQSPRFIQGQRFKTGVPDIGTLFVIDPETTKDGGQVPAFTRQAGYNIKVTSPVSDCVAYDKPVFAQPELDNLMVSYQIQTVNFRTTAHFMLR